MLLTPPPVTNCHTFSDPLPLERDVLYCGPHTSGVAICCTGCAEHKGSWRLGAPGGQSLWLRAESLFTFRD